MTKPEIQKVKDDIKKFEQDTGRPFRTAHFWDTKKGTYKDRVTYADVT